MLGGIAFFKCTTTLHDNYTQQQTLHELLLSVSFVPENHRHITTTG